MTVWYGQNLTMHLANNVISCDGFLQEKDIFMKETRTK